MTVPCASDEWPDILAPAGVRAGSALTAMLMSNSQSKAIINLKVSIRRYS